MSRRVASLGFCIPPDSYPDGLYWVQAGYAVGGFVIKDGRVITCAPVLRFRFEYYLQVARLIQPDTPPDLP